MINEYWELILLLSLINIIFALSLNLILGYNGQFSLGHAGFLAIGAYTSGVLTSIYKLPLFAAVLISIVLSIVLAVIIGYPTLRLRGDYLAIATLGFAEIIRIILLALPADIFGGPTGMRNVHHFAAYFSSPAIVNKPLNLVFTAIFAVLLAGLLLWGIWALAASVQRALGKRTGWPHWRWVALAAIALLLAASVQITVPVEKGRSSLYELVAPRNIFQFNEAFSEKSGGSEQGVLFALFLAVVALVTWLVLNYLKSVQGRSVIAIREDEIAAMNLGINITWMKLQNFMFGSALAGLAGAMLAHTVPLFQPKDFGLFRSVDVLLMVVLGGMGSITGSFLGAIMITIPLELLRFLGPWRLVIYALLLIVLMILRPSGILGGQELGDLLRFKRRTKPAEPKRA